MNSVMYRLSRCSKIVRLQVFCMHGITINRGKLVLPRESHLDPLKSLGCSCKG